MKKTFRLLLSTLLLVSISTPLLADTIRLKDGSVIRGQVIGFKDQQFTILIGGNARGRRGQTTVYVEDVESIEFDSNTGNASPTTDDGSARNNVPGHGLQIRVRSLITRIRIRTVDTAGFVINSDLLYDQSRSAEPTTQTMAGQTAASSCVKDSGCGSAPRDVFHSARGRFSTPGGLTAIQDSDKLMRNEATGALIAVIGDDNDDFILIGPRREFVAQRDGVLFLGVNEGDLTDNTGSYDIVIEAEASGR